MSPGIHQISTPSPHQGGQGSPGSGRWKCSGWDFSRSAPRSRARSWARCVSAESEGHCKGALLCLPFLPLRWGPPWLFGGRVSSRATSKFLRIPTQLTEVNAFIFISFAKCVSPSPHLTQGCLWKGQEHGGRVLQRAVASWLLMTTGPVSTPERPELPGAPRTCWSCPLPGVILVLPPDILKNAQ